MCAATRRARGSILTLMRRRLLALALCLFAVACGSSRPPGVRKADVDIRLMNSLFFGSAGTAAANFEITVTNTADVPIVIHEIRLTSPGMVTYTLRAESRQMNETIDPGESTTVSMTATVFGTPGSTVNEEPFAVRVFLDFEVNGTRHHDYFNILNVTT